MVAATAALFVAPWAAQAQYPPTTTTTSQATTSTAVQQTTTTAGAVVKNFGAIRQGEQFNKQDCGFAAGSSVNVTFNGASAGTATVGNDGCVGFNVSVGTGRRVSFNSRTFTGNCGDNAIVVSNAARTARNTFSITCETATGVAGTGTSTGGVAVTGAAIGATAVIGTALIVLGMFLVRLARRRRTTAA
jgi:hypothetical protein